MSHTIRRFFMTIALALTTVVMLPIATAATPTTVDGVTTIHLDQYNGYFAATETLAGLKPGKYRFVVTNKAGKMVGFQIQDGSSHQQLDMFPLEPDQTRESLVDIGEGGFRYRCPINPTPWYEVGVKS
ncbi:MAG: hypothetical protein Q8L45_13590 [Xanthomonadaceae bacterium]|nr:hypothetical protein [Xanthomonadaceae bacterium]MDP2186003.1 hypothetical protein [Xanthomonadales bacterium]MDZ4116118.1 hypothetical protein [Xanthomonadaceae bacterium]MDZ4376802.1 hypothetical protein [Xanthomonadaceae bacterium]